MWDSFATGGWKVTLLVAGAFSFSHMIDASGCGTTYYRDADGDAFGDPGVSTTGAETPPPGYVADDTDCLDTDAQVYPGAVELCDGKDNDCDGDTDGGLTSVYYLDADGDGFGLDSSRIEACSRPAGYTDVGGDCNDADVRVNPGTAEVCDQKDNDCDASIDEGLSATWYRDQDQDGVGGTTDTQACSQPEGYVAATGDCDDADITVGPAAVEACDQKDNDCDGTIDDGFVLSSWYADDDLDGYGDVSAPITSCSQPDGYVTDRSDCDDTAATTYPGASETCDGQDNDCDAAVDEGLSPTWFRDADGDGFGSSSAASCVAAAGFVQVRGDCNDADTAFKPGATDPAGDAKDQDCGGFDGPDPHVGLNVSSKSTIQAALDASKTGQILFVGPGRYLERNLDYKGKAVTLMSTGLAPATTVDAQGSSRAFYFHTAESSSAVLDGFSITGGTSSGINITNGSPVIRSCIISGNSASAGGGIYIAAGTPSIIACTITGNRASDGAGISVRSSGTSISDCIITGNVAGSEGSGAGGAISVRNNTTTPTTIRGCTLQGTAGAYGGGVYLSGGTTELTGCTIRDSSAMYQGGGVYLYASTKATISDTIFERNSSGTGGAVLIGTDSSCNITGSAFKNNSGPNGGAIGALGYLNASRSIFTGNVADPSYSKGSGGAIFLSSSGGLLSNLEFYDNVAAVGGAIWLSGNPTITHCTLAGNRASIQGGGIYLNAGEPKILNSILAFNAPLNLFGEPASSSTFKPVITYNALYSRVGRNYLLPIVLDPTNLEVDPSFIAFSNEGDETNDDFHLAPGSPLVDAADPASTDPDGSRAEVGAFGGTGADRSFYLDLDVDGLYDGWEAFRRLDPSSDGEDDLDGDGVTHAEELEMHTDPRLADTDGDSWSDGVELEGGSDPTDWYAQPGVAGPVEVSVPGQYPTLQQAIDSIQWEGKIALGPGTTQALLSVYNRGVSIRSTAGAQATILKGAGGTVLSANGAELELEGVTVTGGSVTSNLPNGGGLSLMSSIVRMSGVVVSGNALSGVTAYGGGVFVRWSDLTLTGGRIENNTINATGDSYGGGLAAVSSDVKVTGTSIQSNRISGSSGTFYGGGIYLSGATATVSDCRIASNSAETGQGIYTNDTDLTLEDCTLSANTTASTTGFEAALYVNRKKTSAGSIIRNCRITGNTGEGLNLGDTVATVSNCRIDHNTGSGVIGGGGTLLTHLLIHDNSSSHAGAGVYFPVGAVQISDSVIVNNKSTYGTTGAGVYLGSSAKLSSSIVAYNTPYNLDASPSATILYSDFFNPTGGGYGGNVRTHTLGATNLVLEPAFQAYSADGRPTDLHLSLASPLIDAGDPAIFDLDGSPCDIGGYGGPQGDAYDIDLDGVPDYFWPGAASDAPIGYDAAAYDCDDLDASVAVCK